MLEYLIEQDKKTVESLRSITKDSVNGKISKVLGVSHEGKEVGFDELNPLISSSLLPLEPVPYTRADGVILVGDAGTGVIIFDPPPMGSIHLLQFPSDRPKWNTLPRITVDQLIEIINTRIRDLENSISNCEAIHSDEAPKRRMEQRQVVDKLRNRLAEFRALSYMGRMELSRATMILMTNLEHEIHEEIEKSTKKN